MTAYGRMYVNLIPSFSFEHYTAAMKRIGRYEILGRLGRGGMSNVYKARAPVTGRIVALKVLQPRDEIYIELVGEERLREIFLEEAKIMGGISHDHVAKVIDCDDDDATPFIVLEYFAHSIGALIGEAYLVEKLSRKISVSKAYAYLHQTLRGLERLHFAGIVHRDIKPYNLMVTNDDRIKIIDFGLSRVRGEEKMAIPGMQVGSPYYAAPEQERDPRRADERSDLFSLGVLAYRMMTGKLVDARHDRVAPPSSLNSELNSDWDELILRSIDLSPEERFVNTQEMAIHLEEVYTCWARQSEEGCLFFAGDQAGIIAQKEIRWRPQRIKYKDVRKTLSLNELMRKKTYLPHRFEVVNPYLLHGIDTGLFWQRLGSDFTLNWDQAKEYISYLNRNEWQGRSNWRLPTTEELLTILRPPTVQRDFCFDTHFSNTLHWLWSSDFCSVKQAWIADIVESYIDRLDTDGTASVCAVSSLVE